LHELLHELLHKLFCRKGLVFLALDGVTVSNIVYELREKLLGGRIDKISQPERDEIILSVRSLGQNYKLLFTAGASSPRVHITTRPKENPMAPPLFCMVLRKHIANGKIIAIDQPDFERIVIFTIESVNEMGDFCTRKLIIEIMGKHSNLILTGEAGEILDSAKRISFETSSVREVLPGKTYVFPPSKEKISPLCADEAGFMSVLKDGNKIQNALYQSYNGISPIMASELCYRSGIDPSSYVAELSAGDKARLYTEFSAFVLEIHAGDYVPMLFFDEKEKPFDFACVKMLQFAHLKSRRFETVSELLETFYAAKDAVYRSNQKSQDLKKLVQLNIERCVKKKDLQQKTLKDIANRGLYKTYGELLTANIYAVEKGMSAFVTLNYYEEKLPEIKIPLDPNKSAAENAQRYFKRYAKEKRTFTALQEQIKKNDEELHYLEGILAALQNALQEGDIEESRNELADGGFVKKRKLKKGMIRQKKTKPYCYLSSDGFRIYVGKNNRQNDELTLKFANGGDYWLHTKEIPGSHVIIKTGGVSVPERTLNEAAMLAAFYSKARDSSLVPVDYTMKKNVKKPSGAKPGMVIYETNKTAYVTPDERIVASLKTEE
jgi:predicted ribosome quality control (RQC) complex YloA/Tae2 family protein